MIIPTDPSLISTLLPIQFLPSRQSTVRSGHHSARPMITSPLCFVLHCPTLVSVCGTDNITGRLPRNKPTSVFTFLCSIFVPPIFILPSYIKFHGQAITQQAHLFTRSRLPAFPIIRSSLSNYAAHNKQNGDGQAPTQQAGGWIDGGVRERGGGGFSGLSAEANGFVPANFAPTPVASAAASTTSPPPSTSAIADPSSSHLPALPSSLDSTPQVFLCVFVFPWCGGVCLCCAGREAGSPCARVRVCLCVLFCLCACVCVKKNMRGGLVVKKNRRQDLVRCPHFNTESG